MTALDIDYTAQDAGTVNLGADGTYIIAGVTHTKINHANEAADMVMTNGVGIIIQPAGSDYTSTVVTAPLLRINLASIISGFSDEMDVRVWCYVSASNDAANYDLTLAAIEEPNSRTHFRASRGWIGGHCHGNGFAWGNGDWWSPLVALYSNDVMVISAPGGVISFKAYFHCGTMPLTGAWPTSASLLPVSIYNYQPGGPHLDISSYGAPSNWNVVIGALRANGSGTAFSTTISRLKIEYKS